MNLVNNLFNIKQLRIVIQKSYFKIKLLLIYGVKQFVKEAYIKALVGDKISEWLSLLLGGFHLHAWAKSLGSITSKFKIVSTFDERERERESEKIMEGVPMK